MFFSTFGRIGEEGVSHSRPDIIFKLRTKSFTLFFTTASNATVTTSNPERLPNQPSTSTMPRSQSQRLTGLLSYLTGGTTPTTSTPTDSTGTISERRKGSEDYDTQSILSMGPGETAEISRQQRHALSRRQAMLQYEVGVTTKVVKCLISEMHPEKVVGMLPGTPVYRCVRKTVINFEIKIFNNLLTRIHSESVGYQFFL